jgi:hypothetical protein
MIEEWGGEVRERAREDVQAGRDFLTKRHIHIVFKEHYT